LYIPITNQQSSIVNEMGGGADISLFPGKKPGVRRNAVLGFIASVESHSS
jgi:hypothetical protein